MADELYETLMEREVPQQPPVPMGFWQQLMQYLPFMGSDAQDIELPAESGIVDPKLPKPVGGQLLKAFQTANKFATGQGSPIERLQKAGQ